MLKKMRWRFIASAMAAIVAVVLVLVGAVNFWNYHQTTQWQDQTLERLWELSRQTPSEPSAGETPPDAPDGALPPNVPGGGKKNPLRDEQETGRTHRGDAQGDRDVALPGPFGGHSAEFRYMLRYFSVQCDPSGAAVETNRDFIASVTPEEALVWAEEVVRGGKQSGYLNGYRYLCREGETGPVVLFLNSEREIQSLRAVGLVSATVALVSLLAVFGLVVLLSGRAIAPYVRNIETQKRFITDAGHELKTPLTAIATSADLLHDDLPDNEWVDNIRAESARLARLVGDLVTLSRLDEERPFPEQADFSLSDVVWEVAEPVQSLALAKGKHYEQVIDDALTCHGDRAAIQQMVSILLDNALKYTPDGGTIRLTAGRVRGRVQLEVFNTCEVEGMDVSRLFDRFYRPDASRATHTGGTGIGLSIARATAQANGGEITARAGNGGLTFTVRL